MPYLLAWLPVSFLCRSFSLMRRPIVLILTLVLACLIAGSVLSPANAAPTHPHPALNDLSSAPRPPVTAEHGEQIARDHLLANAATYGVSREDLAELVVDLNEADPD